MPVTSGSGNPKWTRDETLVALDLFYRFGALDRSKSEVVQLSDLLRRASSVPHNERKPSFRNADGVALKMQNLLSAMDPSRGLSSSLMDKAVVVEFPESKKNELHQIALVIRAAMETDPEPGTLDAEEVFIEGEYLTVRHRQRDRRLRSRLLQKHNHAALVCEMCGFTPRSNIERTFQESYFEAHHRLPLAIAEGSRQTVLADMALLCAGCHRFIHSLISKRRCWVDIKGARDVLQA